MRRAAVMFILLTLLWQSAMSFQVGAGRQLLGDLQHAALHWIDEGHHHHDDGSYHVDESDESIAHLLSDHAGATAALLPHADTSIPAAEAGGVVSIEPRAGPPPCLAGPLRPPRRTA
jgi:hypothetical protein